MSIEAEAKNLRAIKAAIIEHNGNCGMRILAILMNPFEVDRLGWDEFEGIPITGDSKICTGTFHLLCEGDHGKSEVQERETVLVGKEV
jgi:hypothetical protein